MKTINQLTSLITLLLSPPIIAADSLKTIHLKNACSFHGAGENFSGGIRSFASDGEARLIANRILLKYDMSLNDARFQLRSALGNRVTNATAGIENGQRFILYRQSYIQEVNRAAGTPWAGTAIMAHEIAHHLLGHTLGIDGSRIGEELKADRWAGAALKKLGASQNEATAVFRTLPNIRASATHPGQEERIDAAINGWMSASTNNLNIEFVRQPTFPEPEMLSIRGGIFMMGSEDTETERDDDEIAHQVSIADFSIGKYEVTVGEFKQFVMSTKYLTDAEKTSDVRQGCNVYNGKDWVYEQRRNWKKPGFMQNEKSPVVCVSQRDAMAYAKWLSKKTGRKYNLPTEAQWEFAARAGTKSARYWGNSPDQACNSANVGDLSAKRAAIGWQNNWAIHNCSDNQIYTSPVGRYSANQWGLMDVMGNVWEWTCSAYDKDYRGSELQCTSNNINKGKDASSLRKISEYIVQVQQKKIEAELLYIKAKNSDFDNPAEIASLSRDPEMQEKGSNLGKLISDRNARIKRSYSGTSRTIRRLSGQITRLRAEILADKNSILENLKTNAEATAIQEILIKNQYPELKDIAIIQSDSRIRVLRGGSWSFSPDFVRSADRNAKNMTFRSYNAGFRLSRTP